MVGLEKLKSEFWDGKYQEKDYCFDEEGIVIAGNPAKKIKEK